MGPVAQTLSQYPQSLSRSPSPETISLFDFFRYATAPASAAYFPSDFWTAGLLQLAHSEPAIWHAAIALGTLHRRWEVDEQNLNAVTSQLASRAELTHHAMEHQVSAMSRAKELNDPFKILVLSLALVSISNIMGRWSEGRVHFNAAMQLLRTSSGDKVSPSAAEMLSRLDVQTMTFVDSTAPYPYEQAEWLTQVDRNLQRSVTIDSYGQAATGLFAMFRRSLLFDEAVGGVLRAQQHGPWEHELRRDLFNWERKMVEFEQRNRSVRVEAATAIRMYHTLTHLLITVTTQGGETRWDRHLGYFERILACVEVLRSASKNFKSQHPFSLELGLVVPLYVVATRCRHPLLRRRAVARLVELKSQEGIWNSDAAAAVAKKVISVEERTEMYVHKPIGDGLVLSIDRALSVPWEAWSMGDLMLPAQTSWDGVSFIPETNRVREILPLVSLDERSVNMRIVKCSADGKGYYGDVLEDTVYF